MDRTINVILKPLRRFAMQNECEYLIIHGYDSCYAICQFPLGGVLP